MLIARLPQLSLRFISDIPNQAIAPNLFALFIQEELLLPAPLRRLLRRFSAYQKISNADAQCTPPCKINFLNFRLATT